MQPEYDKALNLAKLELMRRPDSTFFTTICFSLKILWDESIPTACVNDTTMYINPKFFMGLNPDERVFVLVHESMHVALMHIVRLMGRDHEKFNVAADHVINLMLLDRKFQMPHWVLKDPQYAGLSTEEVYNLLPDDPNPPSRPMGGDIKAATGDPEKVQSNITDILVRARIQSKMAGDKIGTIPGDIEIFLDNLLNPKLPWHAILRKYLRSFAKTDYSMRKPNRRFFPKHHLPSLWGESLMKLAIFVDISGSVSDDEFKRFVSEIASLLKMMKPDSITLGQFDTEIKSVDEVRNIQELMKVKFTGRGGTLISPVFQWANKNKPQALLIFSDGGFRFYDYPCNVDTMFLIHDNPKFVSPIGKVIHYAAA